MTEIQLKYRYENNSILIEWIAYKEAIQYDKTENHQGTENIVITNYSSQTEESFVKSKLGNFYTKNSLLDKQDSTLFKLNSINFYPDVKKEIKGFSCFKTEMQVIMSLNTINFSLWVTDEFENIPIKHRLMIQFPELKYFPLKIESDNSYSAEVTEVLTQVNVSEFSVVQSEYQTLFDFENGKDLIKQITGQDGMKIWAQILRLFRG